MYKKEIRVQWFEVDYADVVYFGDYFRYFTMTEDEFLSFIGLAPKDVIKRYNVSFTRIEATCRYIHPAHYFDLIEVHLQPILENDRFLTYEFEIFRKDGQILLAKGKVRTVCIRMGKEFKVSRMPEEVFERLRKATDTEEEVWL